MSFVVIVPCAVSVQLRMCVYRRVMQLMGLDGERADGWLGGGGAGDSVTVRVSVVKDAPSWAERSSDAGSGC